MLIKETSIFWKKKLNFKVAMRRKEESRKLPSRSREALRSLVTIRTALIEKRTDIKNSLNFIVKALDEAKKPGFVASDDTKKTKAALQKVVASINKAVKQLDEQMSVIVRSTDEFRRTDEILQSILIPFENFTKVAMTFVRQMYCKVLFKSVKGRKWKILENLKLEYRCAKKKTDADKIKTVGDVTADAFVCGS